MAASRASTPSSVSVSVSILAAGLGKRMRSETPKILHQIAGRSMVGYVLQAATELVGPVGGALALVVGHGHEQVRASLGDAWTYVEQAELLGTGHACFNVARRWRVGQARAVALW